MNVKLLRRIKRHILAEPKRLYMSWFRVEKDAENTSIPYHKMGEMHSRPFARCGTAACIAGWAIILSGEIPEEHGSFRHGLKLIDITAEQGSRLFEPSLWPEKFTQGKSDDGTAATAKVAAARIEHFIKTKGAE